MRAASTLAVLTLGSLGIAAPKLGGIGSGLGALGELGLGILSGQADANDCRTWKTGCAQPSCSLYQIFVGGYCQDTNTPNIVCFRGQMWDSSRRTCVTIPAGQPGSTIVSKIPVYGGSVGWLTCARLESVPSWQLVGRPVQSLRHVRPQ